MWHYEHANANMISKAIEEFDWDKAFSNKFASILTKTIFNIMIKFIPNEIVTIDDGYSP